MRSQRWHGVESAWHASGPRRWWLWPWGWHSSRESHRDGRNEEVPGKESAQPQDKEADPDQVVAVGISQKVTPRTRRLGCRPPSTPPRSPPPESGLQPPSLRLRQPREAADGNCSSIQSALRLGAPEGSGSALPTATRILVRTPPSAQLACPVGRLLAPWPPSGMRRGGKEVGCCTCTYAGARGPENPGGCVLRAVDRARRGSSLPERGGDEAGAGEEGLERFLRVSSSAGSNLAPPPGRGQRVAPLLPTSPRRGLRTPAWDPARPRGPGTHGYPRHPVRLRGCCPGKVPCCLPSPRAPVSGLCGLNMQICTPLRWGRYPAPPPSGAGEPTWCGFFPLRQLGGGARAVPRGVTPSPPGSRLAQE